MKYSWKTFALICLSFFYTDQANSQIRAIVFDLGGVVVRNSNEGLLDFLCSQLGIEKKSLPTDLKKTAADLQKGLVDETDFWLDFARNRNGKLPENWSRKWKEFYLSGADVNLDVIQLVETLKTQGYLTPLLSDTIESHYQINLERGLFNIFEPVFNSIHTHLVKPDPKIFDYVLSEIKTNPYETVFIDDDRDNINGAIHAGIVGIQFIGVDQLKTDLRNLNIHVD